MNNPLPCHSQVNPEIAKKTSKILETIDRAYGQLRQHAQIGSLNFINRISLNLEQNKLQKMLDNLVKGYLVIKHSQSTKQPHKKYLYISQDRRFLCWKSLDKSDQKMIQLRKIEFIAQSQEVTQFRRSTTLHSNSKKNSFIVMSQTRNLEIQCTSQAEAVKIVEELEEAVKNSKRMHLSYRF